MDSAYICQASHMALFAAFVAAMVLTRTCPAEADADNASGREPTVSNAEEIFTAWRRREACACRFRAEWIVERTYTKYWANCHVPFARDEYVTVHFGPSRLTFDDDRLRFDAGGVEEGAEDAQFGGDLRDPLGRSAHDDARRVFRDDRIRYDGGRPRVDPREPVSLDWPRNLRPFTTIFDGQRNLQFLPSDHGLEAEAYWVAGAENQFRWSLHYLPMVLAVRPSWLGVRPENCRIESANELVAGRECSVLIDATGLRREFWLDPGRNFSVVSYREECDVLGARMKNRIDISYRCDATGAWLPAAWTTVFYDNRGLMEHYAPATVLSAATEPSIEEATFSIEFPTGTWVFNEASGRHHIVGASGDAQPISANELQAGLSHTDLIARGNWPGRTRLAIDAGWRRTWVRFLVFAALFGAASVRFQKRAGRQSQ